MRRGAEGRPALGSATRARTIWDLRRYPWDRRPRFYPPGEHPDTFQMRRQLALLVTYREQTEDAGLSWKEGGVMIADLTRRLAAFEAAEDESKRIAWERLRRCA